MNKSEREQVEGLFGYIAQLAEYQTKEIETRTVPLPNLRCVSLGNYSHYATQTASSFEYKLGTISALNGLETSSGCNAYREIQGCIKRLEAFIQEAK